MRKKLFLVLGSVFLLLLLLTAAAFITLNAVVSRYTAVPNGAVGPFFQENDGVVLLQCFNSIEELDTSLVQSELFLAYLTNNVGAAETPQTNYLFQLKGKEGVGLLTDLTFPDEASAYAQFAGWLEQCENHSATLSPGISLEYCTPYASSVPGVPQIALRFPGSNVFDRGYLSYIFWDDDLNAPLAERTVWFQQNRMLILSTDLAGGWDTNALQQDILRYCKEN